MKPGDGRATRWVLLNLDKDHPDYSLDRVWERLSLDSLEAFTSDAKAWLKDRSELGGKVIDNADWREVYEYFRDLSRDD